jgi:cold shock CspA family protein
MAFMVDNDADRFCQGDRVPFDIEQGQKGPVAENDTIGGMGGMM